MLKKLAISVPLAILAAATVWVFAAGTADDPLVSLSYLTEVFQTMVDKAVDQRLNESDTQLVNAFADASAEKDPAAADTASVPTWTEIRLKKGDTLRGVTGTNVLMLAGSGLVVYESGAVLVVTTGSVL